MASAHTPPERGTVLVVEDDPFILRFVKTVLDREGFSVVAVSNGLQAVNTFFKHSGALSLMLVDIETPELTGAAFVDSIPTLNPRVPVIFTSTGGERQVSALARKGYPLLYKPFTPGNLVKVVRASCTAP